MKGRITGMAQYGKSLAIFSESSIAVTDDNGKEPNERPKNGMMYLRFWRGGGCGRVAAQQASKAISVVNYRTLD
jgi:hypothetical protein